MSAGVVGPGFARVLGRELARLAEEIEAYDDAPELWEAPGTTRNAPGTLALHLAGNLSHFVGAALGGSGYVRDRRAEFERAGEPARALVEAVTACRREVERVLDGLDDAAALAPYPGRAPATLGDEPSTVELLAHLTWHLGWHMGQIDYHRRIAVGGGPVLPPGD